MKIQTKIGSIKLDKVPVIQADESVELVFEDIPTGWEIKWFDNTDPTKPQEIGTKQFLNFQNKVPNTYIIRPTLIRGNEVREGDDIKIEVTSPKDYLDKLAAAGITKVIGAMESISDKFPTVQNPSHVALLRSATPLTYDLVLWAVIQLATKEISFDKYKNRINDKLQTIKGTNSFYGIKSYNDLKTETEEFLKVECKTLWDVDQITEEIKQKGFSINQNKVGEYINSHYKNQKFPYLSKVADSLPAAKCAEVQEERLCTPILLELLWSYWHEEGMLVQTLNAISIRFQNKTLSGGRDPLANLEIDPLRPLNNLLWGYIQDEQNRLTVVRRAYEYEHHYGLSLYGKAVPELRSADSRSKFLEAFHNLINTCTIYYKEVDDTTIYADAFPLRNALRDVHLLLAEGAHNQYGDLPWTARGEMLMQQWLLARPEMREFLKGRDMVPYDQDWMQRIDTMKKLQGWSDVTVTHFHNLAVWGEQILLSIRHGNWNSNEMQAENAANWSVYWRNAIQGYIHAYRSVTGVDLATSTTSNEVDSTKPSILISRRMAHRVHR